MVLDPQVTALLESLEAQDVPALEEMNVPQSRALAMGYREMQGETQDVAEVRDLLVPGPAGELPVRIYFPNSDTPLPILVFFHGGGWVFGDVEIVDKPCRALANAIGCIVASVEFRRSPETKFPGPVEDCYAATAWIAGHAEELGGNRDRVGVAGDSAGGNLAAAVTLVARDRGGPRLAYQLLAYPVTAPEARSEFASYTENAEGYLLTRRAMVWFWGHYLASPADGEHPYAAPLRAQHAVGLPPATLITCEFDPLRDEAVAYAEKLRAANVPVTVLHQRGMIHGFLWLGGVLDRMNEILPAIAAEARRAFAIT